MSQRESLFTARASGEGDDLRLVVAGELDLVTVAELGREIRRVAHVDAARIVIDVSELTFCDLTGQRALLTLVTSGACLTGAPPRCLRVLFEFTGHGDLLPASNGAGMVGADR